MINKEIFEKCKTAVLGFSNLALVSVLKERIEEETLDLVRESVSIPEDNIAPTLAEEGISVSNMREKSKEFKIKCSKCGVEDTVPFEPKYNSPVYCKDCYSKMRDN